MTTTEEHSTIKNQILELISDSDENGISSNEICEKLKIDKQAIYTAVFELKQNDIEIISKDHKYYLKNKISELEVEKENNVTLNQVLEKIQLKDGISSDELVSETGFARSTVYTTIKRLKRNGYSIVSKNRKYYLKAKNDLAVAKTGKVSTDISLSIKHKLSLLNESDRQDFLEATKKSLFYKFSADAIIKANEIVNELSNSLEGRS